MALELVLILSRSLTLAVLGLMVMIAGCDRQSSDKAQPMAEKVIAPAGAIDRSHKGSIIPELGLNNASGEQLRLSSLKGKPLLINLWATWCGPCVKELPQLAALHKSGAIRVLAVSQDMGEPAKTAAFLMDRGLAVLDSWLDPQNDLSFHYATGTLPTSVLYDAQGREVWRFVGERDWTSADTAKLLAEAKQAARPSPCCSPKPSP